MRKVTQMRTKLFLITLLLAVSSTAFAQYGDPSLLAVGTHTGNRVGISFHNDGQIAGILPGVDIRGEWPLGSGENYIGDMIPLIGVEFINFLGDTLHSVIISRGPRNRQAEERSPADGHFWGWNPIPGFRNPNYESVAMSHLPDSWPIEGWNDPVAHNWFDSLGHTQWFGYFGRDIKNADQESLFDADDQQDDEFNFNDYVNPVNPIFLPDSTNPVRHGMGLRMRVRGFQWSNFLAEDVIFWLYDILNEGTTIYRKADFGTVVGTLAGGDGDSNDDLGYFDVDNWITYSWDSDGIGNKGQKVGYVGYAFLESPGNPFDGIDNDNDDSDSVTNYVPTAPRFVAADFDSVTYGVGDVVVLINPNTYVRTLHTINSLPDTVTSLGVQFIINPGEYFREGNIAKIVNGISIPDTSAFDGIDNDLDGLIDENEAIHYKTRVESDPPLQALRYINYRTGAGVNDLLIDERRDNNIDEDGDWNPQTDDVGIDGLGPNDNNYPGPDEGEGNGVPDQGEPNFGRTDTDESDQIGLTGFNFFNQTASPDMTDDELLWDRMTPGRFDVIPPTPQDGDFIYSSGYFPLIPSNGNPDIKERFSFAILFGENYQDIVSNKLIVQQIYNAGYKFPQPPQKPTITLSQQDGKVVIYWDGKATENDIDFITKKKDFQGYKIYRSTDANFTDSRTITNGRGILSFDEPIAQYDLVDSISGFFYPSPKLLEQVGGTTYYLGDNTGIVNRFIDSSVVLGQTYYYAVCSYDRGDNTQDIFPTENSKFIRRTSSGEIILDKNTGYITPGRRPAGYDPAAIQDYTKSEGFKGTGQINIEIVDDKTTKGGNSYKIAFTDTGAAETTAYWSLLNLTAGDTLVNHSSVFSGNTPIREGFRVQIHNDSVVKLDTSNHSGEIVGGTSEPQSISFAVLNLSQYKGVKLPNDYQIEFYPDIVDTSIADPLAPAKPANFKVKNLTKNQYIDFIYATFGQITTTHSIIFKETVGGGAVNYTWRVDISYGGGNNIPLETSGTLTLNTLKPFGSNDEVTFTMKGANINDAEAKDQLNKIKVVPNPYVVTHEAEARLLSSQVSGRGEREIRFTYIPPGSTISIYTVRGEKIKTLTHDDLFVGDVYWNLRTEENLDVAYGVYVFVVEAPGIGTKIGKFALIK
jgi:hypothetical protein